MTQTCKHAHGQTDKGKHEMNFHDEKYDKTGLTNKAKHNINIIIKTQERT